MPEAVIVDVVRTAGGKRNGALSGWHPVDLAAETLKALAERNNLDPELVDDVIMGCVMQAGAQALNVGRNAVLAAGWPESVPSTTDRPPVRFLPAGVPTSPPRASWPAPTTSSSPPGVEVMSLVPMGGSIGRNIGFPFGAAARPLHRRRAARGPAGPGRPGHLGRDHRQRVGPEPRGPRRLRRPVPGAAPSGPPTRVASTTRSSRSCPRSATRRPARSRCSTSMVTRDEGIRPGTTVETPGQAEARLPARRQGDRRQQLADHRRRLRRADHERREGQGAGPHPAGPVPHLRPRRRRPGRACSPAPSRPPPRPSSQAGLTHRRHRPRRDQRGVRLGRAGLGEGARPRHGQGQPQRRRHRPGSPPRLLRHQAAWPRCSTSSSAPAAATACRPCARAAAWRTPPSSSAWAET